MNGPSSIPARGQAETISVVLLLLMTVAGTITILMLGTVAFDTNIQTTALTGTEHSLTQFDSRAAVVALGESNSQEVSLGRTEGAYQIREDAGSITITHHNHSGAGNNEVIYNGTLGTLVYENGQTEIAYQGGGGGKKGTDPP